MSALNAWRLEADDEMQAVPGRFGRRRGNVLHVGGEVATFARQHRFATATELLSWAMAFPDEAARELGWTRDQVDRATHSLQRDGGVAPNTPKELPSFGVAAPRGVVEGVTTAADLARRRRGR